MTVRVVVVDDHADVRAVVLALLAVDPRFAVVGEAADGVEGVEVTAREQPDVVLLDLSMPVMDGLTALPLIRRAAPRARVVVLSAFGTDESVRAALSQGAAAFLHKGGNLPETLVSTVAGVSGLAAGLDPAPG